VLVGKGVRVGVGGNHTIVGVGLAVGMGVGVAVGDSVVAVGIGTQAASRIVKTNIQQEGLFCIFNISRL
jgi:hypothetical protein